MNTDKGMDLLKRSISILLLLAIYVVICFTGVFSFVLAGIVTPIYYFVSIRVSRISYEGAKDFIKSTLIFLFFSWVTEFILGGLVWELEAFSIYSMMMYLMGSSIYYIVHIVHIKRNDTEKRIFPIILLFVMYILINILTVQLFFDNDIIMYLLTITLMAVVITLIYYFLTRHVFGINIEGETFIFLSVDFIYFILLLFLDDSFGGVRAIVQAMIYPFMYLTGKGAYFLVRYVMSSRER